MTAGGPGPSARSAFHLNLVRHHTPDTLHESEDYNMTSIQPPANRPLSGKVAIVTGSTSGIGEGIARALAAQGATIVMNGFGKPEDIEKIRIDIEATHMVSVIYDGADMSKSAQINKLVKRVIAEFGRVDIVVNNAGIQFVKPIDQMPQRMWDKIIKINLTAAFTMTKAAVRDMKKRKWGRIINISSAHGLVGSPGKAPYVASKHGINGLSKVAALDTATAGITSNAICPGWVDTPLFQKQVSDRSKKDGITYEDAQRKIVGEKQPNQVATTVDQIGAFVVFLCSDAASTITGATLSIDGGWTAE
jgi:3-hydroxybutyrate dehydrogenase